MKTLLFTLLLISGSTFAQNSDIGVDGYGKIRIGTPLSDVEKLLKPIDSAPEYAWFAIRNYEWYKENWGIKDSSEYLEIMETEGNNFFGIPKDKFHGNFMGLRVQAICLYLNENDVINGIRMVLNEKDVTLRSKVILMAELSKKLGDSQCIMGIGYKPETFICDWGTDGSHVLSVSDMEDEGEGQGKSINISFFPNEY